MPQLATTSTPARDQRFKEGKWRTEKINFRFSFLVFSPPFSKGPDSWSWEVSRLSPYGSWHRFLFFLRSLIYPLEFRYLLNFFFSLPRRLKIELTREKNKTWIVMGLPSLNRSKDWKELFLVPTALQKSTSKISNFFFSKILEPLLASSESSESS